MSGGKRWYYSSLVSSCIFIVVLLSLLVNEGFGGQAQIGDIVRPLAAARLADLHQEFSILRELQDHIVVEGLDAAYLAFS